MTTNYHTPHSNGAPLTSAGLNAPLGTLDAQITALTAAISGQAYDPRTYGALGDDSHDDTTAFQTAIDTAIAQDGYVRLSPGTYKVTAALTVSAPLAIIGQGGWAGLSVIHQVTANTAAIDFAAAADGSIFNGIKVIGPTGNASGAGIYARKTVHMTDVWVVNFFDSIDIGASGAYYAVMSSVFVQNAVNIGFHIETACYNMTFLHPKMHGCATGMSAVSHTGLRLYGGSCEQNTTRGLELTGTVSRSLLISGMYFESAVGSEDIRLGGAATLEGALIEGCRFADNTVANYWHINAFGVNGLTLINNYIGNSGAGGGSVQTAATTPDLVDINCKYDGTVTVNAATKRLTYATGTLTLKGLRVATPSALQSITGVGSTIAADAEHVQVNPNGVYTLTSAPTIASGVDGQVLEILNVSSNNLTIQDQGTLANSNLRLIATTQVIGPRDSIRLRYSSQVGDWIQTGAVVNVL